MNFRSFLWSSFLVGLLSFGGGKAFIPIYQKLYVEGYSLISFQTLQEYIGYALAFPGPVSPIITGLVGFFGWGVLGFITGILILTIPPILLVYGAYFLVSRYRNTKIFQFVSIYLQAAVFSLLIFVALEFLYPQLEKLWTLSSHTPIIVGLFFYLFTVLSLIVPPPSRSWLDRLSTCSFLLSLGVLIYIGLTSPVHKKACIFMLILLVSFWMTMRYRVHPILLIFFAVIISVLSI